MPLYKLLTPRVRSIGAAALIAGIAGATAGNAVTSNLAGAFMAGKAIRGGANT